MSANGLGIIRNILEALGFRQAVRLVPEAGFGLGNELFLGPGNGYVSIYTDRDGHYQNGLFLMGTPHGVRFCHVDEAIGFLKSKKGSKHGQSVEGVHEEG